MGQGTGTLASEKKGVSFQWSKSGRRSSGVLLILSRGSSLCMMGMGSMLSLLYTFVTNIAAVTVCSLISLLFPVSHSYLSL